MAYIDRQIASSHLAYAEGSAGQLWERRQVSISIRLARSASPPATPHPLTSPLPPPHPRAYT